MRGPAAPRFGSASSAPARPERVLGGDARVGVEEEDRGRGAPGRAGVAAGAEAGVPAQLDDAQREVADGVGRAVGVVVVDDGDGELRVARERLDAVAEVAAAAIGDDHDVDGGHSTTVLGAGDERPLCPGDRLLPWAGAEQRVVGAVLVAQRSAGRATRSPARRWSGSPGRARRRPRRRSRGAGRSASRTRTRSSTRSGSRATRAGRGDDPRRHGRTRRCSRGRAASLRWTVGGGTAPLPRNGVRRAERAADPGDELDVGRVRRPPAAARPLDARAAAGDAAGPAARAARARRRAAGRTWTR